MPESQPNLSAALFRSFLSSAWERDLGSSATPDVDSGSRASQTGFPSGAWEPAVGRTWERAKDAIRSRLFKTYP